MDRVDDQRPALSVVVCTLGRAAVAETVSSIAASAEAAGCAAEIVVAWQGSGPAPELGAARMLDVVPIGLSHARNRGLASARAPVVAFVDDDEVVDPGWAAGVLGVFARRDAPDGVFGPVAPLDDRGLPYCTYEGDGAYRLFTRRGTAPWIVGTGGNMAFGRAALNALGGFDERFGAGAPARSGDESELVLRLLASGRRLAFSPEFPVYHPTKTEPEHLASRYPYGFGMGATLRRHRAPILAGHYLATIVDAYAGALRRGDARRRREVAVTFRSFLAGVLSPLRAISPADVLERLPAELRPVLDHAVPEPLEATLGEHPELRYTAGPGRLLVVHVNPSAGLTDSLRRRPGVIAQAPGRDALWVVERSG